MAKKKESQKRKPKNLTTLTFLKEIRKPGIRIIDCWAPWCGPCRYLSPIIEELAQKYSGKISFGKLNVEENKELAMKAGIMSIPTLLVWKDGQLIERLVGAIPKDKLEEKLKEYLEKEET